MKVLAKFASTQGRRDELPNITLAKSIISKNDKDAVKELFELIQTSTLAVKSDCIKVIYEIAEVKPELLSPFIEKIISLLEDKNNRIQWGTMSAIHALTKSNPQKIYKALPKVIQVADKGSVITNDHFVGILAKLGTLKNYYADIIPLLLEKIESCPTNQLPSYAEQAIEIINGIDIMKLTKIIKKRMPEVPQESKQARLKKVLKKLEIKI